MGTTTATGPRAYWRHRGWAASPDFGLGTYLHGPFLPRNPHLADALLRAALARTGQQSTLHPRRHGGMARPRRARRTLQTTPGHGASAFARPPADRTAPGASRVLIPRPRARHPAKTYGRYVPERQRANMPGESADRTDRPHRPSRIRPIRPLAARRLTTVASRLGPASTAPADRSCIPGRRDGRPRCVARRSMIDRCRRPRNPTRRGRTASFDRWSSARTMGWFRTSPW